MRALAATLIGLSLLAFSAEGGEGAVRRKSQPIPGSYIVVLDGTGTAESPTSFARSYPKAKVRRSLSKAIKGLVIEASDVEATKIARDPRVRFVEEDSVVTASGSWGLDRIDQRALPLDGRFFPNGTGSGVTVFVVDTGIAAGHPEFGGRVAPGFTSVNDGNGTSDCSGHGTHVAGVVAGSTQGVARAATLVPVRVLDCKGSGSVSSVLAGLEWVLHQPTRPAVVNISLGGSLSYVVDLYVEALAFFGFTPVVAAGNDGQDACRTSPARTPDAITVGATTAGDSRAAFSNYGTCIDIFAPGVNISSASTSAPNGIGVKSGTSFAAPFVAGAAALLLEKHPWAMAPDISETLKTYATTGVLAGGNDGSPNRLLFVPADRLVYGNWAFDQLLADPGFEQGDTFWSSDVCTVVKPTGCDEGSGEMGSLWAPRTGEAQAVLGGPASSFNLMSEPVKVPSTATFAELGFYLWIVSRERSSRPTDILNVEIRDASGALIERIATFSNLDASASWLPRRFDVKRFAGRTIRVAFSGVQAQGAPTWFYLDDVTVIAGR